MKLTLVSIDRDGVIRTASTGNLTATDFPADGKNLFEQLLGMTWSNNRVMLNMEQTQYIDSTAIGWLISCQKAFKANGGTFVVHSVQPGVKQVLDLLKIGKVVPIHENETAARSYVLGAAQ